MGFSLGFGSSKGSSSSAFSQKGTKDSNANKFSRSSIANDQTTNTTQASQSDKSAFSDQALSQEDLQFVNNLDTDTQNLLKSFLSDTATSNDAKGLADFVATRAIGGDLTKSIEDIVSNARLQGKQDIGRATVGNANEAGSSLNSFVQQTAGEQYADLNSQLAGLTGELNFKAREIQSAELSQALQGIINADSSQAANVSGIANVLKGATQETSGSSMQKGTSSSTEQSSQLSTILEALTSLQRGTEYSNTSERIKLDSSDF